MSLSGELVGQAGTILADGSAGADAGTITFESTGKTILGNGSLTSASGNGEASSGGTILVVSDANTIVQGGATLAATGGATGDGGLIKIGSGTDHVFFNSSNVSTAAPNGKTGTLYIDPPTLTIADGAGADDHASPIDFDDATSGADTVYETTLEGLAAATNIILEAQNTITLNDLTDDNLNLATTSGNVVVLRTRNDTGQGAPADSATGGITFTDLDDAITTAGGDIRIEAGYDDPGGAANAGSLVATSDSDIHIGSVTSGGGSIYLRASGEIQVEGANAGAGNIELEAGGGAVGGTITDSLAGAASMAGSGLTVSAHDGAVLDTAVTSITAHVTGTGNLVVNEADGITLTDVDTADGSITVTANGAVNATDVASTTDNNANDISITTTGGGIAVGSIAAGAGAAADVLLAASGGITDANGATTNVTADDLSATGVGINLDTDLTSAALHATGTSNIDVDDVGSVTFTDVDTADGTITLDAVGAATLTDIKSGGAAGNITVTSGGLLTATLVDASEPGDISLTGVGIAAGLIDAGAANNVTLDGTTGAITDANGAANNVVAANLTADANTGIDLDTSVATVTAHVATPGALNLNELDGITLTDLSTANGALTVTAGGAVTATSVVSTTDADANDISITTTAGGIAVGAVTAGAGAAADVVLNGGTGAITDGNGAVVNVVGDDLNATAGTTIDLDTTVNSLTALAGSGSLNVNETDGIALTNVSTANGALTVTAGGAVTATSVASTTDNNANDISITTTAGGIAVGAVTAGAGAAADVVLNGGTGAITDGNGAAVNVVADDLNATAATGLDLDTTASSVTAAVTGAGALNLNETDGITLTNVSTANGALTVTAGGAVTATSVASTTDNDANDINITTTAGGIAVGSIAAGAGAAADVILNGGTGAITDGNGAVVNVVADDLNATAATGLDLDTTANSVTGAVTGAGALNLNETDGITLTNVSTANGALTVTAAGAVTATSVASTTDNDANDISITTTAGGIAVGSIAAGAGAAADVVLNGGTGAITDGNGALVNVVADDLNATAATGLDLDTTLNSVTGAVTGAGALNLNETDGITLTNVSTANGALTVTAGGAVTATSVASTTDADANDISIATTAGGIAVGSIAAGAGGAADVVLNGGTGAITDGNGAVVNVTADDLNATAATGLDLDTTLNSVTAAVTGAGALNLNETNGITLTNVSTANGALTVTAGGAVTATSVASTTDADANDISITTTAGGIAVGAVTAGAGVAADVVLNGGTGAITDGNGAAVNVVADDLNATAATGIALDTSASSATLNVTGTGNLDIDETDGITFTNVDAADGAITLDTGGATVLTDIKGNGNITVTSTGLVTATLVDSSDPGDISVTGAGIAAGLFDAGAANNVTLDATTGAITDANGAAVNVIAADLDATATTGIDLDTTVDTATLHVTGTGAINIGETDGITFTDVDTNDGTITLDTGGATTLTDIKGNGNITVTSTGLVTATLVDSSDPGDISVTAAGIAAGLFDAGPANNVTLDATTGAITDANGAAVNVIAADLDATATTGIDLDTTVDTVTAHVTGVGALNLDETNGITLTNVDTADGAITITAAGAVVATDVASLTDNNANDISITTTAGGIAVGSIAAGAGAAADVILNGGTGAITDGNGAVVNVVADDLNATAATGLDVDTTLNSVTVAVTGAGALNLNETDGITLTNVSTANGALTVTAGGAVTATSVVSTTDNDANDISITTTGNGIAVDTITAGAGAAADVTLDAGTGAVTDLNGAALNVLADALSVTATTGIDIDTDINSLTAHITGAGNLDLSEAGALTLTDVTTANGSITATAGGLLTATSVNTNNSGNISLTGVGIAAGAINAGAAFDVTLDAGTGAITDTNGAAVNVTGDNLLATATTGIDLDTTVATATLHVTGTGAINIGETDGITFTDVDTNDGTITLDTGGATTLTDIKGNGNITVTSTGLVTATLVDSSDPGDISVTAAGIAAGLFDAGPVNNVTLDATTGAITDANGAAVNVIAADLNATATTGIDLDTTVDTVTAHVTGVGALNLDETNGITLTNVDTADGAITITAAGAVVATDVASLTDNNANDISITTTAGGIAVGSIAAGAGAAADVILNGGTGAITDGNGAAVNVVADDLNATAATGIDLDTTLNSVTAAVTGAGALNLNETDGITLSNLGTANGPITVTAGGAVTATAVASLTDLDANDISITTTAGGIAVGAIAAGAGVAADVILDAGTGAITDANGAVVNVTADDLSATAATGIDLDTTVNSLTGHVTGVGTLNINETDGITLTDVDTANGPITVTAAGPVTAIDVASLTDNDANDVSITTTSGGIAVYAINAGAGAAADVILNGATGSVTDGNGALMNVVADDLNVTAATGIDLDTTVNTLTGHVTGIGALNINETDGITLTDVDTANGPLTITAGGAVVATDVASLTDADANDISITTTAGGIAVGSIAAGAGAAADVTLDGGTGAITDGNGAAVNVVADDLNATATTGIDLDTTVNSLNGHVTGVGALNINETDGITLTNVDTANGPITITAGGAVVATDVASLTDADANDISITTTAGGIAVGAISAGAGVNADVILDGGTGAITDGNGAVVNVVADDLSATAATGIDLDTTVNSLTGHVTGVGALNINETDGITLTDVDTANGPITITAGGAVVATDVASLTDADANDISITTTAGGIAVGSIAAGAGAAADVTLDGGTGAITDGNGAAVNVVADDLNATAATGIDLDTTVNSLTGHVTGVGTLNINETDGITLTNVDTANGPITITAGGAVVATDVASLTDTDANDISITTTAGGIAVGTITAGAGVAADVILDGGTGAITDGNGAAVNVVADDLNATATTGIDLDTTVNSLTGHVTGVGALNINETDGITLTNVDTANGPITITAGGAVVATDVASLTDTDANDISITTTAGGIAVGTITAGAGVAADVILDGGTGAITDGNGAAVNVVADDLSATAATGIDLDTTVNSLTGHVTGVGALNINETDGITLTNVDTANGPITITAGGAVVATDVASLTDTDANDISITTTAGGIAVGTITAGAGVAADVILDGGTGAITDGNGAAVNVVADDLSATAATGIDLDTTVNSLTGHVTGVGALNINETDGITLTNVDTANGPITITAGGAVVATDVASLTDTDANDISITTTAGGIAVGTITAGAGVAADVILDGGTGAITDGNGAAVNVVADDLNATAATGIDLDTTVNSLTGHVTGVGTLNINETDGITLTNVDTANGPITITANGPVVATDVASLTDNDANDISITTTAGGIAVGTITAGAGVAADVILDGGTGAITDGNGAAVNVVADDLNATATTGIDLDTTVNSLTGHVTGVGALNINETDGITLTDVDTANGPITITAGGAVVATDVASLTDNDANDISIATTAGGIQVGSVRIGTLASATAGDVILNGGTGAITDGNGAGVVNVVADDLSATAATGIDLDTSVNSLTGHVTGVGDVVIREHSDITLTDVDTADGSITVAARGQITAVDVDSSATDDDTNDITLTSTTAGIQAGIIDAGDANDVLLVAKGGPITDGPGKIHADRLTAHAAGAMTLDTRVASIVASTVATGDINIIEQDDVTLEDVTTFDGAINARARGNIIAVNVDSSRVDDDTNDITLTSRLGGIQAGNIDAGDNNDVTLVAKGGAITDGPGKIHADQLNAHAAGAMTLDTTVHSINASTTATGDINISETDNVDLTSVSTRDGAITAVAGGNINAVNVRSASTDDGTNNISLTAHGTLQAGEIDAGDNNDVTLVAKGGAITDGPGKIHADDLIAHANGAMTLDTTVQTVAASTTATGDINITESDDIVLADVSAFDGSVKVVAKGDIDAAKVRTSRVDDGTNNISITSTEAGIQAGNINAGTLNDVTLVAKGGPITHGFGKIRADQLTAHAAGAMTLDTTVNDISASTTAPGAIVITETDAVDLNSVTTFGGDVDVTAHGQIDMVHVKAHGNITAWTDGGAILAQDVNSSDPGDISLTGVGIVAGRINAGAYNDVMLNATTGAITDGNGALLNVIADDLNARAGTGINLDTRVNSVTARVRGTGDLVLRERDSIVLTDLSTHDGAITVGAGGQIDALYVDSSATDDDTNDITLTSNESGIQTGTIKAGAQNDVTLVAKGGPITHGIGRITADVLTAYAAGPMVLYTDVQDIIASTTAIGDVLIDDAGSVDLESVTTFDGAITARAEGDINAVRLWSARVDDDTNDVTLTANGALNYGEILAGSSNDATLVARGGGIAPISPASRITADVLTANANGPIALNTTVNHINASTNAVGDINISETDGVALDSVNAWDGSITARAGGDIDAVKVWTSRTDDGTNNITLTSTGGAINAGEINAGANNDVTLVAKGGAITDGAGKITADVLWARAHGAMTLDTTVASLNAATDATGDVAVTETDGIELTNVSTRDGAISVVAGGPIAAVHVDSSRVDDDSNDITLTSIGGAISYDEIKAGESNDVTLVAKGGGIAPITAGLGLITADNLRARAAGAMTLLTDVNTLDAVTHRPWRCGRSRDRQHRVDEREDPQRRDHGRRWRVDQRRLRRLLACRRRRERHLPDGRGRHRDRPDQGRRPQRCHPPRHRWGDHRHQRHRAQRHRRRPQRHRALGHRP